KVVNSALAAGTAVTAKSTSAMVYNNADTCWKNSGIRYTANIYDREEAAKQAVFGTSPTFSTTDTLTKEVNVLQFTKGAASVLGASDPKTVDTGTTSFTSGWVNLTFNSGNSLSESGIVGSTMAGITDGTSVFFKTRTADLLANWLGGAAYGASALQTLVSETTVGTITEGESGASGVAATEVAITASGGACADAGADLACTDAVDLITFTGVPVIGFAAIRGDATTGAFGETIPHRYVSINNKAQ
ncbi:MAG: hypothetical protein HQL49_12700, partial [Gammaproteobacteria bacterium]|nr:hypothetical protein [Gammaproteobacteria bacterium]